MIKLVLRNAAIFQTERHKAILQTVKFSTVLVNLLCSDLTFVLGGFTNNVLVLNCYHVVLEDGFVVPRKAE